MCGMLNLYSRVSTLVKQIMRVHLFAVFIVPWALFTLTCVGLFLLQGETFCKYKLYLDHEYTCTKSVSGTINPSFESEKKFTFNPVTKQVTTVHVAPVRQFTFHISLPRLKPSLFIYHSHDDFDSADPSSMQDACHLWTQLNDLPLHDGAW